MDSEKRTDEFDNDKQTDRLENNEITNEEIIYVDDLDDDYLYINKNNQEEINEKEEVKEEKKSKISIDDIINGQKAKKMEKLQQQRQWGIDLEINTLSIEKSETTDIDLKLDFNNLNDVKKEKNIDKENQINNIHETNNINKEKQETYIYENTKFSNLSEKLNLCIQVCKLFEDIHKQEKCFNSITLNDIVITPQNECKIKNTEKIVEQNAYNYDINYEKTSAPEILNNKSRANINTDRHSLAFLLFEILFDSNPFEGSKVIDTVYYTKNDELNAYKEPIFVYSYKDKSNMPVRGIHSKLIKDWNEVYTDDIKIVFIQSFVDGINNPELRIDETTFIQKLIKFKDIIDLPNDNNEQILEFSENSIENKNNNKLEKNENEKDSKHTERVVIADSNKGFEEKKKIIIIDKDKAQTPVKKPKVQHQLQITYSYASGANEYEILDLLPGTEIINSIVGYEDIKPTQLIGKVVQNVKDRSILGLKNISNHEWIASKGSSKNVILPGKVLVIMDGVEVDFYPENRSITKTKWSIVKP